MSWIKTISYDQATGALTRLYDRVRDASGYIDNILMVHSLRPHTLKGHMALYKNVLHHRDNAFPKWFLETIGVYVSMLNSCDYCVDHHFAGLQKLLNDNKRSITIWNALRDRKPGSAFQGAQLVVLEYAVKLTCEPHNVEESDIQRLRIAGLDDGEILEVNQVVSYFGYANRTVLGLGVTIDGDVLGLSPGSTDEDDWGHEEAQV